MNHSNIKHVETNNHNHINEDIKELQRKETYYPLLILILVNLHKIFGFGMSSWILIMYEAIKFWQQNS